MMTFPHCEVVIRTPDGVAWAGTIPTTDEQAARKTAMDRYTASGTRAYPEGPLTVDCARRDSRSAPSILG